MKQINWGFIGCGEVTEKKSGPAFNEVEGSQVVAVMSRSENKARSYAERHHVRKWYTDASELIEDPDVNAVYIATPPSSHAIFAIMAMRAGKPCYIEKPLAASYNDCIRINRISEQTGVPCFVAYYRRYLPYFQKVKEIIESGTIGNVVNVQVRFSVPPRDLDFQSGKEMPWRLQPDIAGGGYFYDLAPHQIDLLQNLFGVITRAHGYPANRAHLYQAEDTLSACFFFESGIPGSGSWCFVGHESAKEDWRERFALILGVHLPADRSDYERRKKLDYGSESALCAAAAHQECDSASAGNRKMRLHQRFGYGCQLGAGPSIVEELIFYKIIIRIRA